MKISKYKCCFQNGESSPEKALWKAVILQAFIDLQNNSKKKISRTYKVKALFWFNRKNQDFINTCLLADLEPNYVLTKVEKIKNKLIKENNL